MSYEDNLQAISSLAHHIEKIYQEDLRTPLPYEDCRRLRRNYPRITHALIPDLDTYFSFIAGFSSSAATLARRSRGQLYDAIPKLKLCFFETYPEYQPLAKKLNPDSYPKLFEALRLSEELRRGLTTIIESIVSAD